MHICRNIILQFFCKIKIRNLGLDSLLCGGVSHIAFTVQAVAAWKMVRGEVKSTGDVLIFFLPFPNSLGSPAKESRLNIASVLMWCEDSYFGARSPQICPGMHAIEMHAL